MVRVASDRPATSRADDPRAQPQDLADASRRAAGPCGPAPGRRSDCCCDLPRDALAPAGAFAFVLKEAFMFEEQPQPEIDALIKANPEFKQLYQRHQVLDKKVMDAELGVLPIDDTRLGQMKREKLAAKDRLVRLYDAQH